MGQRRSIITATVGRISHLDAAITRLAAFHEQNLIKPSQVLSVREDHFFATAMQTLRSDARLSALCKEFELPPPLLGRLTAGLQIYTDRLNRIFHRSFSHHSSLVLAVDPVSSGARGVLTHERMDPAKKMMTRAITGGGLVDGKETALEAAFREFREETGGGCLLTVCRLALVVDGVKSGRPYFMSCVYRATHTGEPNANAEAKNFEEIPSADVSRYKWFSDHAFVVQDVLDLEAGTCSSYPGSGIPYTSKGSSFSSHLASKPFKPLLTNPTDVEYISNSVEIVVKAYRELMRRLEDEFVSQVDEAALLHSCNEIGHGWEQEAVTITPAIQELRSAWNDDKRLWDFMGPLKLAAVEISGLFGTFINTGEGGVIEMVPLYLSGDRVFLPETEGGLSLHKELLTQFRNFRDSLRHHAQERGVPISEGNTPTLIGLYEDPGHTYQERIRSRVFEFVVNLAQDGGAPHGTKAYSIAEVRSQPREAWINPHDYHIFHNMITTRSE